MSYEIIKRDGTKVPFDKQKIVNAINKAFVEVDGDLYETDTANDIANEIETDVRSADTSYSVEHIQDLVEEFLMRSERHDVAKAYIKYRYKKEVARNNLNDFVGAIREKLDGSNIQNQNANVDEMSFGGRRGEADNIVNKKLALDYIISPMARENHLNNRIYIHDLDSYYVGCHNCLSIPFDELLAKGFNTRQTDVRPAGSVSTAFQLIAVIFQLQSLQQFGGVSATHIDWTMVPYVRKSFYKHFKDGLKYLYKGYENAINYIEEYNILNDMSIEDKLYQYPWTEAYEYALDMTIREVHQGVEGLYHNLNTLQSRSGNQLN